jgi:hypothetical protein
MESLRPPGGPPGGVVISIAVPALFPLAIGRDLDSRLEADACGRLSEPVGVNGLLEMGPVGDRGGQLGPEFGAVMGVEGPGEAEGEGALGCEETALIAPSRRRRPKFI